MMRGIPLVVLVFLAACGGGQESAGFSLPPSLESGWHLASSEDVAASAVPGQVRDLGMRNAVRGEYEGPAPLSMTVYIMNEEMVAFELMQKWRPSPGQLAFYTGRHFVVLESPDMDHGELGSVADAAEKAIEAGR